jgi:hypothetical protein
MDTDQLIKLSRARFDHENARRVLKEKYQAKMLFAYREGMWRAGPELLSLLDFCDKRDSAEIVILDLYETPIKVNCKELWNLAAACWQEQMNAWLIEFENLRQQR